MPGRLDPTYTKKQVDDILSGFTASSMKYLGDWNASTNTPALTDGTGVNGQVYRISTSGTQDLGSGSTAWVAGDFIYHNGTVWGVFIPAAGSLRQIVKFENNGSFTKATYPWLKFVKVRLVGGGGSGGKAATAGGQAACAGGGGGGGYSEKIIAVGNLLASETVTVGAAGTAGASGDNDGGTGGTTSFGAHCSATGGAGGAGAAASAGQTFNPGGAGGVGSSGDLNIDGDMGGIGFTNAAAPHIGVNNGGGSQLGGIRTYEGAGKLYGGGGGGVAANASTAATAGFAGAKGVVIVELYG